MLGPVALALHGRRVELAAKEREVFRRQFHLGRRDVFFEAFELRRPRDRHDPGLLSKDPRAALSVPPRRPFDPGREVLSKRFGGAFGVFEKTSVMP